MNIKIKRTLKPKNSFIEEIVFVGNDIAIVKMKSPTRYKYPVDKHIRKMFFEADKQGKSVNRLYLSLLRGTSISKEIYK